MKPIAWIRPCESEGAVLEWDKPHPSDCADPAPLYHGSDVDAHIAELTAEVDRYKADAKYMQWIGDNAEVVTTWQGMRLVLVLNVFGNNNWSLRDYLSMEINGTMHGIARNALRDVV